MNKKAFLLTEETLKIVIASICIIFLIYLLVSLYFSKLGDEKLKQAENLLKDSETGSLKLLIENLGEGQETSFQLPNPKGWYLIGFTETKKPNSCTGKNCLCICDGITFDNILGIWEDRQLKECDEGGTCLIVENLNKFDKIQIDLQVIHINKINNQISIYNG